MSLSGGWCGLELVVWTDGRSRGARKRQALSGEGKSGDDPASHRSTRLTTQPEDTAGASLLVPERHGCGRLLLSRQAAGMPWHRGMLWLVRRRCASSAV